MNKISIQSKKQMESNNNNIFTVVRLVLISFEGISFLKHLEKLSEIKLPV